MSRHGCLVGASLVGIFNEFKQNRFEKSWTFEASVATFIGKATVIGSDGPNNPEGVMTIVPEKLHECVDGAIETVSEHVPINS